MLRTVLTRCDADLYYSKFIKVNLKGMNVSVDRIGNVPVSR